jgi:hypothetical protein
MAPEPDPAAESPSGGRGGEEDSEWLEDTDEKSPDEPPSTGIETNELLAVATATGPEGGQPAPPRRGVRMAELEARLTRLEDEISEEHGPRAAANSAGDEAAAVEDLRRAIFALEARVDANLARLQKVEAADAARLRRFDTEVRKISAAATAGLRQALEEAAAAAADAQRLARAEPELAAELRELRAELDRLRGDRESDG